MMNLDKAIIDVKESHVESLPMVVTLFGKTAGLPKNPPDSAPQPAVVPFYPYRVLLPRFPLLPSECRHKTIPAVYCCLVITYPQPLQPFPQLFSRL
jgi:hypothetical protein